MKLASYVLVGLYTENKRSGKVNDFFTFTPRLITSGGRKGLALDTRFCVSMFALSRSVPTSNETCNCMVPL